MDQDQYRYLHRYIIGKTGTGKSTTLINLMLKDIAAGDGVFFIDPHGDDAITLLNRIPKKRRNDVILFDLSDRERPIGFNVFENVSDERKPFVASSIVDTFKSIWGYTNIATPVLDQYLYNATAALLDYPGATLIHMKFMLTSAEFRKRVIEHITDPVIRDFWQHDFAALTEKEKRETTLSTRNKLGMLIADPRIRNVLGQRSAFTMEEVLRGKILIARLPQGKLGIQKTAVIGSLLLATLHSAILDREDRSPFHIYIDECHHFATPTLIEMLSGIRKFGVSLTLAHQYLDQLPIPARNAILGTVGTKIAFRVGVKDAQYLETEFIIDGLNASIADLPQHVARISAPHGDYDQEMPTLPEESDPEGYRKAVAFSQRHYGKDRDKIQASIERIIGGM